MYILNFFEKQFLHCFFRPIMCTSLKQAEAKIFDSYLKHIATAFFLPFILKPGVG